MRNRIWTHRFLPRRPRLPPRPVSVPVSRRYKTILVASRHALGVRIDFALSGRCELVGASVSRAIGIRWLLVGVLIFGGILLGWILGSTMEPRAVEPKPIGLKTTDSPRPISIVNGGFRPRSNAPTLFIPPAVTEPVETQTDSTYVPPVDSGGSSGDSGGGGSSPILPGGTDLG
jgi:hypothetical protein